MLLTLIYRFTVSASYYDPLLKKYFGNPKLETFKEQKQIINIFDKAAKKPVEEADVSVVAKKQARSNTQSYHQLVDNLKLEKVLVGSFNREPFYAMVDGNHRICLPCFDKDVAA